MAVLYPDADVFAWWTDKGSSGIGGAAFLGGLCHPKLGLRTSVNEYRSNPVEAAFVSNLIPHKSKLHLFET